MKHKFTLKSLFGPKKSQPSRPRTSSTCNCQSSSSCSFISDKLETPKSVIPSNIFISSNDLNWSSNVDMDVFNLLDCDGDGKISRQELELMFHRLGLEEPPTDEDLALMLSQADADGDGCISFDEYGALSSAMGRPRSQELREAFNYYDSDRDGKISAEELLRVFYALGDDRCTLEDCRRMIGGVDVDHKGFVCFDDFRRMMKMDTPVLN